MEKPQRPGGPPCRQACLHKPKLWQLASNLLAHAGGLLPTCRLPGGTGVEAHAHL